MLLVALALVSSSCAHQKPPGVDALVVSTDLVFGVKDKAAAAPAATPPPNVITDVSPSSAAPARPPLPALLPENPSAPVPSVLQPAVSPCPSASITDFPQEAATRNVPADRRPAVGSYRWKRTGTMANVPVGGFETREIGNVVELPPATDPSTGASIAQFTFDTVQTDLRTHATIVRTWQVKTGGESAGTDDLIVSPTLPPAPGAPVTTPSGNARAGEPDRGVALKKQVTTSVDGTSTTFAPTTPLLVLPLPVRPAETFSSTAVDPSTFQTMSFSNATVQPSQRVDACGQLVDGWPVQGSFQFVGPDGQATTFTYGLIVVPQLGGIIAREIVDQTGTTPGSRVDWTIGQLKPDVPGATK